MDLQPLPFPTRSCAIQEPPSALSTHKLQRQGSSETHPFQTPLPAPPIHSRKTKDLDKQDDLEDTRVWRLARLLGQQLWRQACRPLESGQMDGDARR